MVWTQLEPNTLYTRNACAHGIRGLLACLPNQMIMTIIPHFATKQNLLYVYISAPFLSRSKQKHSQRHTHTYTNKSGKKNILFEIAKHPNSSEVRTIFCLIRPMRNSGESSTAPTRSLKAHLAWTGAAGVCVWLSFQHGISISLLLISMPSMKR